MDNEAMNLFYTYGPLVFMVLVVYFLIIRPQRKQQKERQAMLDALIFFGQQTRPHTNYSTSEAIAYLRTA